MLLWKDGERTDAGVDDQAMGVVAKVKNSDWAVVQLYDQHPGIPTEYCSFRGEEVAEEDFGFEGLEWVK